MNTPDHILERKRAGLALTREQIHAVVAGAASGAWGDAELGAFLMAAAIRGLDQEETATLVAEMLASGERWRLAAAIPGVVDKHSTGGVGDKVSLVLGPLLAACGVPVVMLTGRTLGHTGGTADKLETIPGLGLELDRERAIALLRAEGLAIGVATGAIAPADRRLYALRDRTATVASLPLVIGSILSKKLATGAAAIVFDVKTGNGAFFADPGQAGELAERLVAVAGALGCPARALVTDMSEPLGEWAGNAAEVQEALDCLEGRGDPRLMTVTMGLAEEAAALVGAAVARAHLERAIGDGSARERFTRWAIAQGGDAAWLGRPRFALAPRELVVTAAHDGVVAAVATRRLGAVLAAASRAGASGRPHPGVAARYRVRLGQRVRAGEELLRLYLPPDLPGDRSGAAALSAIEAAELVTVAALDSPPPAPPELIVRRVAGGSS